MGKHQFARGVKCGGCGQVVGAVWANNQHEAAVGQGRCAECMATEVVALTQWLSGEMVGGEPEPVVAESATVEAAQEAEVQTEPEHKRKRGRKAAEPVGLTAADEPVVERRETHGMFLTRH